MGTVKLPPEKSLRQARGSRWIRWRISGLTWSGAPATRRTWAGGGWAGLERLDGIPLLDHLISAGQERRRNGQAERLGSLEVDHQLEFPRLLHRQVARLSALQNSVDIDGGTPPYMRAIWTIAQQASPLHPESVRIHSWQLCLRCQRDNLRHGGVTREWGTPSQQNERPYVVLRHRRKCS